MHVSEDEKGESQGFSEAAPSDGDGSAMVLARAPELVQSAKAYATEARARRTREEYAKQWAAFCAWCTEQQLCELPAAPQTLALYLAARADSGRKVATLAQALAAISQAHKVAGHPSPRSHRLVQETWKGIRRRLGVAQDQKQPIGAREIRLMVDELPTGILGFRDRALVTLGFAGGFRRSELVALDVNDLTFVAEGLEAVVRRSKTDQEGEGLTKVVAYGGDPATCPVRAVKDWLEFARISEGPVFRPISKHEKVADQRLTGHAVAVIVKRCASKAAHSSGFDHRVRRKPITESSAKRSPDRSEATPLGVISPTWSPRSSLSASCAWSRR